MKPTAAVNLYDQDFALWVKSQVAALRDGRLSAVDIENVTEELEALAKRDRREIENRLRVLGAHLLKRRFQPEKASRSWDATILEQGTRIQGVLKDSPSLRREMPDFFFEAYNGAVKRASAETGLEFPEWPETEFLREWCNLAAPYDTLVFADTRNKFIAAWESAEFVKAEIERAEAEAKDS